MLQQFASVLNTQFVQKLDIGFVGSLFKYLQNLFLVISATSEMACTETSSLK
jgi:hypothetical protein